MDHEVDDEMDKIFDLVDSLCHASHWDAIDLLLLEVMDEEEVILRLSWLTITLCVKSKLKNRQAFFYRTIRVMYKAEYSTQKIHKIISGLR